MPTIILPVVETFTIPILEWTVTDFRNLDSRSKGQTLDRFLAAVAAFTEAQGIKPAEILCEIAVPKQDDDSLRAYSEAVLENPNRDWASYRRDHPVERFRFHTGIENRAELLSVSMSGRIIGGIHFATFMIEEDTPRKLTCRAMIWVGVEPTRGRAELDVWMEALTFMIDTDLRLEDGRVLDFIGYDFVSDRHMKDGLAARTPLVAFLARMADHFDDSGPPDSHGDVSFRRVGASKRP